ncbi:MAG: 30S ribosomal protein S2 [Patescibacteria group bacterium]
MSDQTIINKEEAANSEPSRTIDPVLSEEMVKAGVLYGRKKSKTHPRMKKFINAVRNGISIVDLAATLSTLESAGEFLKEVAKKQGVVLVVGTRPAAQQAVENFAKKSGLLYVIKRWLGGTLTNFKTISSRIQFFTKLKADKAAGKLEKYTKKEQVNFDKQIDKLTIFFSGLENMTKLPDVLLVVDINEHETAVREANRLKIPVIGITNTDSDPESIAYPIPANDNGMASINWILNRLSTKIEEGIRERSVPTPNV